jgi:hypothetical protein
MFAIIVKENRPKPGDLAKMMDQETYGYKPDWTVRDFLELAKRLEQEKP